MIRKSLIISLKAVSAAMCDARDPWWVIASAAVALHGADAGRVADVDVLLSEEDAARILPSMDIDVQSGPEHPDFRSSIFGTWTKPPLPVEFMAGFHYRLGSEWLRVEPQTRQLVAAGGVEVFVPCRTELRCLLERFGRPKDIERARRLEALG